MAFQRDRFRSFFQFLKMLQRSNPESQATAENFILEERLTEEREDSYANYVTAPQDWGCWNKGHENYLSDKIFLNPGSGIPETFTDLNRSNLLLEIDENQFLVRVENLVKLVERADL